MFLVSREKKGSIIIVGSKNIPPLPATRAATVKTTCEVDVDVSEGTDRDTAAGEEDGAPSDMELSDCGMFCKPRLRIMYSFTVQLYVSILVWEVRLH